MVEEAGDSSPVARPDQGQSLDRAERAYELKGGREHRVPLSAPALAIAESMKTEHGGEFLFPGGKLGKALSNMAMLALLKCMERPDLIAHGFRSTFRDWAAERTSYLREVVEMALAHVIESKVEAAYRRGDLFAKRVSLMAEWAKFCAKTTSGARWC